MKDFILVLILIAGITKCAAQTNPVTYDTVKGKYREINITFEMGKVDWDSLPREDFMYIHDKLFLKIYNTATAVKSSKIIFDQQGGITALIIGKAKTVFVYKGAVLLEKQMFGDNKDHPEAILKNDIDSEGRIISSSEYRRVQRRGDENKTPEYYLHKQTKMTYQHADMTSETTLSFIYLDSLKPVTTERTAYDYYPTHELHEVRQFYGNAATYGELRRYEKNGNFIRYNYDRQGAMAYYTRVEYNKKQMKYRISKNADSTLSFMNKYQFNKRDQLVKINSIYKKASFREVFNYDKFNRESEKKIFKNDKLLYRRICTYNEHGELNTSTYFTPTNKKILSYEITYQ